MQKRISATDFKAKCLSILDHLDADGLVITKHGEAVAKIFPVTSGQRFKKLYGSLKDRAKILGDIMTTGEAWHAES